jgi:siroheme synthase
LLVVLLCAVPATAAPDYGTGKFYIVGMGTAPDLITLRGARVVKDADIILLEEPSERE